MIYKGMGIEVSDDCKAWEWLSPPEIVDDPRVTLSSPARPETVWDRANAEGRRFARMRVDGGDGWETLGPVVDTLRPRPGRLVDLEALVDRVEDLTVARGLNPEEVATDLGLARDLQRALGGSIPSDATMADVLNLLRVAIASEGE